MSSRTSWLLPSVAIALPGCAFSAGTAPTMSSRMIVVSRQSGCVNVFDTTYFRGAFIMSPKTSPGGIGSNAIQGARLAGAKRIVAIDPVEFKREQALKMGATHTAPSIGEAFDLIQEITWGRMCDKIVCAVGVGEGEQIAPIMTLCAKRGRVVVTNIHPAHEAEINISQELSRGASF